MKHRFITSISPNRIERQQLCLESWKPYATEIVAVQVAEEIPHLQQLFPDVRFVPTTLTAKDLYNLPTRVRIKALVDQGPGLLINSDIKLWTTEVEFEKDWTPARNQFNVGIRYDFDGSGTKPVRNKYGIDAFLITEQVMERLPDIGFPIGVSVWDYWIIWHMMCERFHIKCKTTPGLIHLRHQLNWSEFETTIGLNLMSAAYGLKQPKTILDIVIQIMTERR